MRIVLFFIVWLSIVVCSRVGEDSIIYRPVTELLQKLEKGELTSLQIVQTYLQRTKAVNEHINAIVEWNKNAEADAKKLDEYYKENGKLFGPLHGIPVTIKDQIAVKGFKQSLGLPVFKNFTAPADSEVVARLRAAGAVIIGTTNMMELGFSFDTDNRVYGRTKNPYDLERSPGGSSGGEAAIIAAGGSPLGLGTDLGGSARVPAHFCGVVGIKPTQGRLSNQGTAPFDKITESGVVTTMASVGILSHYIGDAELALQVLSGPDFYDPQSMIPPYTVSPVPPKVTRVAYFIDDGQIPSVHSDIKRAVLDTVELLRNEGVTVIEDMPPAFTRAVRIMFRSFAADGGERIKRLLTAGEFPPTQHITSVLEEVRSSNFSIKTGAQMLELQKNITMYRRDLLSFFKNYDALIIPPCVFPAVKPELISLPTPGNPSLFSPYRYTFAWNAASIPALVVGPITTGTGEFEGLPVGVQIVVPPFKEDVAFEIGRLLEKKFPLFTSLHPSLDFLNPTEAAHKHEEL